jgi:hypothetical protein
VTRKIAKKVTEMLFTLGKFLFSLDKRVSGVVPEGE